MNMTLKMNPGHDARNYFPARPTGAAKPRTLRTKARPPRNALAYAAVLEILG